MIYLFLFFILLAVSVGGIPIAIYVSFKKKNLVIPLIMITLSILCIVGVKKVYDGFASFTAEDDKRIAASKQFTPPDDLTYPNSIYGFWGNADSYVIISKDNGQSVLYMAAKTNKQERLIGHFILALKPVENVFTLKFTDGEFEGKEFNISLFKNSQEMRLQLNRKSELYKSTTKTAAKYGYDDVEKADPFKPKSTDVVKQGSKLVNLPLLDQFTMDTANHKKANVRLVLYFNEAEPYVQNHVIYNLQSVYDNQAKEGWVEVIPDLTHFKQPPGQHVDPLTYNQQCSSINKNMDDGWYQLTECHSRYSYNLFPINKDVLKNYADENND